MLTWTLVVLYCALVGLWALLSVALWWRRRREVPPDLVGDLPALDPYELVRLDRGRAGLIEVMMAHLLQSGVLMRGANWGERNARGDGKAYRVAVRSALPSDAHALERAFVAATERKPDKNAITNASRITDYDDGVCSQIESRLIAAGLLHDESRRWRVVWFGCALFWIGLSWAIARVKYDVPDDVTDLLFIVSVWMFVPICISMPDAASDAEATPNGRLVVVRERIEHLALRHQHSSDDVKLAVALFGASILDSANAQQGVRDAYELVEAENERLSALCGVSAPGRRPL